MKEQKEVTVNELELYLGTSEKRPSGKHAELKNQAAEDPAQRGAETEYTSHGKVRPGSQRLTASTRRC